MALKFRRGTTAQQSGSLAFGEPYVNTTLGTLLIGGPNGDIVLSTTGTGSTGTFGAISGSGLDITGNANIAGNLTLGGAITIGDASSDTVNVVASLSSSLIPQTTNAFDLGSATKFWRDLYISTGSIKMVNPANNQVVTTINAVAGGGIQIGNVQITTASIAFVDNTGVVTQTVAQSSSVGSTSNYAETSSFNAFTSSQLTQNTALATISGSLILTASANTVSVANLNTTTASLLIETANLESFTSSINTTIKTQLDSNTVVSGSSQIAYASISSIPAGIVSGAAQVTPLLPTGTISGSSQLSGTSITDLTIINLTTVNQTASVVFSSGSNRFGDAGNDTHSFTGSVQISGSLTTIGASTATSFNGTINATNGVISGSSQILGGSGLVSGSSQVTLQSTTGFTAYDTALATITGSLISSASAAKTTNDSQGVSITNLNSATASLLIETANLESFTSSINTTIKSKLDADGVISGSSQITAGSTTNFATDVKTQLNSNTVVSGSSQISLSGFSTTNLSEGTNLYYTDARVKTKLNADGVVSGSAQINVASTTGDIALGTRTSGNYVQTIAGNTTNGLTAAGSGLESADVTLTLAQSIKTDANPQFNSLGIGTTASTTAGEIRATGDITAFYSSDIRLKENIQPIQNALEKVESISGNTYNWKEGYEEIHSHKGNDVGVIAQEIEEILPQIVTNRDNGYKAVQYEKIIPLLIEAIKELSARVNSLENK